VVAQVGIVALAPVHSKGSRPGILGGQTACGAVHPMLLKALGHDGPALVEVAVNRQELSMPPSLTGEEVTGFGLYMLKAVLSGLGDELIELAKTNLLR
jgi:hypothetical protein